MQYPVYVHRDTATAFRASFPDFPGCITAGSTLEEARRMAAEALHFHITGMRQDGEKIPESSTLDDLRNDPAMRGAVAFLVALPEPEKTVRFNVTARASQLSEIDDRARAAKLTRSAYIVHSALGRKKTGTVQISQTARRSHRGERSA